MQSYPVFGFCSLVLERSEFSSRSNNTMGFSTTVQGINPSQWVVIAFVLFVTYVRRCFKAMECAH